MYSSARSCLFTKFTGKFSYTKLKFCSVIRMPESIVIQVGQCGNQIGCSFWEAALREYENNSNELTEDDVSQLFKITEGIFKSDDLRNSIKARCIMLDLEEKVIDRSLKSSIGSIYGANIKDSSGAGNNWAVGHKLGTNSVNKLANLVQKEVEYCSSLDSFILTFSLGGGTGSGLGSTVLKFLQSEYPKVPRMVFTVFPSLVDDVVVSGYNAVLACNTLINKASCVIPFHNQVLSKMCIENQIKCSLKGSSKKLLGPDLRKDIQSSVSNSSLSTNFMSKEMNNTYEDMNFLIRNTMLDVTCSARFQGTLNIDIQDIVTNLLPVPHLPFLVPVLAPLFSMEDLNTDVLFKELFSGFNQLSDCSLKQGKLLTTLIHARGNGITPERIQEGVVEMEHFYQFVNGFPDAKFGQSDKSPDGRERCLLQLGNTTSFKTPLEALKKKFNKMFEKRAHLHHYTDVDQDVEELFFEAENNVSDVIQKYTSFEACHFEDKRYDII